MLCGEGSFVDTLQTSRRDGGWLYSEFVMVKSPVLKGACITLLLCRWNSKSLEGK